MPTSNPSGDAESSGKASGQASEGQSASTGPNAPHSAPEDAPQERDSVLGLSDDDRAWVERKAAELGPLTPEEREYLALIFRGRQHRPQGRSDRR